MSTAIPLPYTPKALADFKASEVLTEAWAAIMEDSTTQRLIEALSIAASPVYLPAPVPGLHPDTATAHHWYFCMGMHCVLSELKKCARKPSDPIPFDEQNEEFSHLIPANLRKPL